MDIFLSLMSPTALMAAIAVTFAAGFVKGAVGFAMPLLMITGMSLFLDPVLVVAAMILPILVTNGVQALRFGRDVALQALREYWRYVLIVCVVILVAAQFLSAIPTQMMYLILGIPTVVLSGIQLFGLRFHIPPHRRRLAEWGIGAAAGTLGGLAGVWGPPTVLYLLALNTPKAQQIVVQGVVYGLGAVTLAVAHVQSGVFNAQTAVLSGLLLIPGLIGMAIGFRVSDRLDQEVFRKATLAVLIIAGLNLVRRGLF